MDQIRNLRLNSYELLDLSIKAQLEIIDNTSAPPWCTDKAAALRDFRTVSVGGVRQIGKTEWIVRHATYNDLVIVDTKSQRDLFLERWRGYHGAGDDAPTVLYDRSGNRLYSQIAEKVEILEFGNLFVDDASWVFSNVVRKKVYEVAAPGLRLTSYCFLIG